uniref:Uncharacterized protein n=1 Tax=Caenorhabditis japonica TaxID=281687 RepID=A0A8R1EAT0_CAEJA
MVHCRKGSCNLAQLGSQYPGWKLRSNLTSITSKTTPNKDLKEGKAPPLKKGMIWRKGQEEEAVEGKDRG